MSATFEEIDWQLLLERIKAGKCTPFLGAGACAGVLPLGAEIAKTWAAKYHYPLEDNQNLAGVAQFLGVLHGDLVYPKEQIIQQFFEHAQTPDFSEPDEPHSVLASLPLPFYLTTNYDNFMVRALQFQKKKPSREVCCWNDSIQCTDSILSAGSSFVASVENPVVFHLHGHDGIPESLVLTEDDYLDFLVSIWRDPSLLPHQIERALTGSSLLFVGYSLADWSFKVLFRGLVMSKIRSLQRLSITIQFPPGKKADPDFNPGQVKDYLDHYFERLEMHVYWGTARQFMNELRERWSRFNNGG